MFWTSSDQLSELLNTRDTVRSSEWIRTTSTLFVSITVHHQSESGSDTFPFMEEVLIRFPSLLPTFKIFKFCSVELNFRSTAAAHTMRQPSSAVLISCFPSRPDPLYPGRSTQTVLCSQMNVKSIWRAFLHWPWVLNILKVSHVWLRLFPITVNHSAACRLLCFCSFSSAENEWTLSDVSWVITDEVM